jgi:PAS domain S-box-containing protein
MRSSDIAEFVKGTSDPAYAVDGMGIIVAWNPAAASLFGIEESEVLGKPCFEVVCGVNEDGPVCSEDCIVRKAVREDRQPCSFDMRVNSAKGRRWFNVSMTVVKATNNVRPCVIHMLRSTDVYKRLEFVIRDFVIGETSLPKEAVSSIVSSARYV